MIHYKDNASFNEELISHELVHRRQYGFSGDGFVPVYFADIGLRMATGSGRETAYKNSIFEAEAYGKDYSIGTSGSDSPEDAIRIIQLFDQNVLGTAPGRF
ncbi:MAG: hypothetical protein IPG32_04935 [Saprospirales bacterium]|nr:hypothetical protein [Saprospirales bacterium]